MQIESNNKSKRSFEFVFAEMPPNLSKISARRAKNKAKTKVLRIWCRVRVPDLRFLINNEGVPADVGAPSIMFRLVIRLIDFFVSRVTAHFADSVFEHNVLLEEVVNRHFVLGVVVHRALKEEAEEALSTVASGTSCEVAEEHEVEAERRCEDRVAAEEVDFNLHWIAHPTKDVDVVPTFLVVVARWIVVDAHFVVVLSVFIVAMAVEVRLIFRNQD